MRLGLTIVLIQRNFTIKPFLKWLSSYQSLNPQYIQLKTRTFAEWFRMGLTFVKLLALSKESSIFTWISGNKDLSSSISFLIFSTSSWLSCVNCASSFAGICTKYIYFLGLDKAYTRNKVSLEKQTYISCFWSLINLSRWKNTNKKCFKQNSTHLILPPEFLLISRKL